MSHLHPNLLAVLFASLLAPLARADVSESKRTYGAGLGLDATRTWNSEGVRTDSADAYASFLLLNHHFHFGPTLAFHRSYAMDSESSTWSLGGLGKWTYEDLQTTDRTPFVTVAGFLDNTDASGYTASAMGTDVGLGYETFFSQNISIDQSIHWTRTWSKWEQENTLLPGDPDVSNESGISLRVNLNLYF